MVTCPLPWSCLPMETVILSFFEGRIEVLTYHGSFQCLVHLEEQSRKDQKVGPGFLCLFRDGWSRGCWVWGGRSWEVIPKTGPHSDDEMPKSRDNKSRREMGQGGCSRRHIMSCVTGGGLLRLLIACCRGDLNYSLSRVSSLGTRTICYSFHNLVRIIALLRSTL